MSNHLYDALFAPHATRDAAFLRLADGSALPYRAFLSLAGRYANTLGRLGLKPGDRLAMQVGKSPEALALYAACARAGVIFLPLNTAYTPAEVAYFIEDATPGLVICDPAAEAGIAGGGAPVLTMDASGAGSFAAAAADAPDTFETVPRGPDDLAAFLYTSGTTGRSKGAMLTHANLVSNAAALRDAWRFDAQDVLLHALPIFHTHGLFVATNICLLAGASMIFLPRFDAEEVIDLLPQASAMMGVPTYYTRLLDSPRFSRDVAGHMRLFVSGSAPLLAETHERFAARTGHRILERYGMTETGMNTTNPYDGERRAGSVGPALPGVEVIVTDPDTGTPLAPGATGMIEVRGPNVFKGYWNMPEKTAEDLRANGFFITGDLGTIGDDGYVTIVGRMKDLIITGGFNVYPKEVEVLLDDQPGVKESAVFGVPHPDFGEAVVGVIVAEPGQTPDLGAIGAVAAAQLANYKRPKRLLLADALPRNAMGKVQKNVLCAAHAELFTGAVSPKSPQG